jgi:hypothetical protein
VFSVVGMWCDDVEASFRKIRSSVRSSHQSGPKAGSCLGIRADAFIVRPSCFDMIQLNSKPGCVICFTILCLLSCSRHSTHDVTISSRILKGHTIVYKTRALALFII